MPGKAGGMEASIGDRAAVPRKAQGIHYTPVSVGGRAAPREECSNQPGESSTSLVYLEY